MKAIPNSKRPATIIKCENAMPIIGSGVVKNLELPNELKILAMPVIKRTNPKLKTNHFENTSCLVFNLFIFKPLK